MISQTAVSLRAWHPSGDSISGQEFVNALGTDASRFTVVGSGQRWEAARIVGFEMSLEVFQDMEEPHEHYAKAVRDSFIAFSKWLATLSPKPFEILRSKRMNLDVFIGFLIDQNQFDLELPSQLLAETGRLNLAIKMSSND
jgi:hypothetical protein